MSEATADGYEKANARVREAAKWLIASAAAVGAALIAGSQLSNIGKLPAGWPTSLENARLWIAVAGACIGLGAVVFIVWVGVGVLLPVTITLDDLVSHWEPATGSARHGAGADVGAAITFLKSNDGKFLQGFRTPAELEDHRAGLIKTLSDAEAMLEDDALSDADRAGIIASAPDTLAAIADADARITEVEKTATSKALENAFRRLLSKLLLSAVLAAAGIVLFAWASNPPPADSSADLSGADLHGAQLQGVNLSHATLDGAKLTGADLTGADLTGASLLGVTWSGTICPDGTNSDDAKGTCRGHLSASG